MKATALGGANFYFGLYTLDVGCTSTSVGFADSALFITSLAVTVGDPVHTGIYTFHPPTSIRAYCLITSTKITKTNGGAISSAYWQATENAGCGGVDPCYSFGLASTTYP